jgi:hypothetical protein
MRRDRVAAWATLASAFRIGLKLLLVPLLGYMLLVAMDRFVQATLAGLEDSLRRAGWR